MRRAYWVHDVVFEAFAAQMHVGEEAEQQRVVGQRAAGFDAIVGRAGRDHEVIVGELQREHALGRRSFCEAQADAGCVGAGVAVGGVVHLEDEIGAGGDEFRHRRRKFVGRTAGSVDEQNVSVGPVRAAAIFGVGELVGGEGNADGSVLAASVRIGRADVDDGVMDVARGARARLRRIGSSGLR